MSYDGASSAPSSRTPTRPRCTPPSTTSAGAAEPCTTTVGRPSRITSTNSPPPNASRSLAATTSRPIRGRSSTPAPTPPSHTISHARTRTARRPRRRWYAAAEQNDVFPLDDGAVNRITHMHVPWTASRRSFRYLTGDKVHEIAGPNIAGGFRMIATFAGRDRDRDGRRALRTRRLDLGLGVVSRRRRRAVVHRRQRRRTHCRRVGAPEYAGPRRERRARRRSISRWRSQPTASRSHARSSAYIRHSRGRPTARSSHRLRAPVPRQRRIHATRAGTVDALRHHHPRRTASAVRPRCRSRAHPAPPVSASGLGLARATPARARARVRSSSASADGRTRAARYPQAA